MAEGEIPCGYVLLVPEGDDAVVFDLSLDDAAHGPEVRALVEDLARREGAGRLLAAYSPGDLVQTGFVTGGGFTVLATQMRLDLDHRLPTDDRVVVGPMTEAEYRGWVDGRTADYVAQRIAAGEPAEVAEQTGREQMATLLPDGLASADTHLLVGRHGEEVVGTLWLSTARPMVYVYDVEVREELRGQGYGAALMRAAAQWAQTAGRTRWAQRVRPQHGGARPLRPARLPRGRGLPGQAARAVTPPPDRVVDLNADLGEEVTDDAALLEVVTSANVACGYHAGNAAIMRAVCDQAVVRGVSVGAQVSYADRANFGRVAHDVASEVLREQVADQVGVLTAIARAAGTDVRYVKPHGALYHRVLDDEEQAAAVLAGSGRLPVLGMPGALLDQAARSGRGVLLEGFPDRGYAADGRLLPRGEAGAVLADGAEVARRAVELARSVHSVCVHGDSPGAVATAAACRAALEARRLPVARSRASSTGEVLTCGGEAHVVEERPRAVDEPVGPGECRNPSGEPLAARPPAP